MKKSPHPPQKSWAINPPQNPDAAIQIWLHVDSADDIAPLRDLVMLMQQADPAIGYEITTSDAALARDQRLTHLPEGGAVAHAQAMKPQICLWAARALDRGFLAAASGMDLPVMLMQLRTQSLEGRGVWFLRRRLSMRQLAGVAFAQPADSQAAIALLDMGFPAQKISHPGPRLQSGGVPRIDQNERETLGQAAAGRPIWFAVNLPRDEVAAAAAAHEQALRRSHRALLILDPSDPDTGPEIAAYFRERGYQTATRAEEGEPDERSQVFVTDGQDEQGLWYSLATLCYLGGTLTGAPSVDPFDPASLGCAILHGPRRSRFAAGFARLITGRATYEVANASELGPAIADHFAPDRAALLAHHGWQVISEGAEQQRRISAVIASLIGVDMAE